MIRGKNLLLALGALILSFSACPQAVAQEQRLALIIGNADYDRDGVLAPEAQPPLGMQTDLRTPASDATDIASLLTASGWNVVGGALIDLNLGQMREAVRVFARELTNAGTDASAVIYLTGHGVAVAGENYLVPVGSRLPAGIDLAALPANQARARLKEVALPVSEIIAAIGANRRGITVIIIDACRNNPWDSRIRSDARGDQAKGLAGIETAGAFLIGFSAGIGEVAYDGAGRNSLFASAFLQLAPRQNLSFLDLWSLIAEQIQRANARSTRVTAAQNPWIAGSPRGRWCLAGCSISGETSPAPASSLETTVVEAEPRGRIPLVRSIAWPLRLKRGQTAIVRVKFQSSHVRMFALLESPAGSRFRAEGFYDSADGSYIPIDLPQSFRGNQASVKLFVQKIRARDEQIFSRTIEIER